MSRVIHYMLCSLLLATGWTYAFGQETPTVTPAQRLKLTLVDNKSTFNIDEQKNYYENTLRLSQADGNNKLTAGMLNEGDNYIVISRQGDTENAATDVARVNLNASIVRQEAEILTDFEFTSASISASGWYVSTSRALSYSNTYGGTRINSGSNYYIRYTIPQGYDGGTILLYIGTYTSGYFRINGSVAQAASGQYNQYVLTGLNSGSTITIYGSTANNGNGNSPYMAGIYIIWVPPTIVPTINVTSTYSKKEGDSWVNVSTLGSNSYSPNDNVNDNSVGVEFTDIFNASTEFNTHSNSYNYSVNMDANIDWSDLSGDFYASVDFSKGDGSNVGSAEYIGPNSWDYLLISYYHPTGYDPALYLSSSADFIYTMPPTFAGNQVNVTVTTPNHSGGVGDLAVNGENHTFTAGSSYTWTLPVSANGVIQFKYTGQDLSCDITKIVIQNGNGSAPRMPLSAPIVSTSKPGLDNTPSLSRKDTNIKTIKNSAKE